MTAALDRRPIIEARGLVKTFGRVVGLDGADFELYPGEVLAVIGDNGAGKSTLIKCLSGAMVPDAGEISPRPAVLFKTPLDARNHGIETVYQTLRAPSLDIAGNLFLGREQRRSARSGRRCGCRRERHAAGYTQMNSSASAPGRTWARRPKACPAVAPTVAVARAAAFSSKVIIDEPTAALGVKSRPGAWRSSIQSALPVILISHNMPQVFEVADRIHIQRLGKRAAVARPRRSACRTPWR